MIGDDFDGFFELDWIANRSGLWRFYLQDSVSDLELECSERLEFENLQDIFRHSVKNVEYTINCTLNLVHSSYLSLEKNKSGMLTFNTEYRVALLGYF